MWGIKEPIVQGELEWEGNWLSPKYPGLYPLMPSADTTKKITYKKWQGLFHWILSSGLPPTKYTL